MTLGSNKEIKNQLNFNSFSHQHWSKVETTEFDNHAHFSWTHEIIEEDYNLAHEIKRNEEAHLRSSSIYADHMLKEMPWHHQQEP